MKRLPDWEARLGEAMAARRRMPFAWGQHDCCTFPADCVQAMTGVDPIAAFRGQWTDRRSAFDLMNEYGGIEALVDSVLPSARIVTAGYASRGDIVMMEQEGIGARLGVRYHSGVIAPKASGLASLDLPMRAKVWHIAF